MAFRNSESGRSSFVRVDGETQTCQDGVFARDSNGRENHLPETLQNSAQVDCTVAQQRFEDVRLCRRIERAVKPCQQMLRHRVQETGR